MKFTQVGRIAPGLQGSALYIAIVIAACLGISPPVVAETESCRAVDELAEIYFSEHDVVSIGVYGDEDKQHCQFSINGATKNATRQAFRLITRGVEELRRLRQIAVYRDQDLPTKDFEYAVSTATPKLIYLAAAPNLERGRPPTLLSRLWKRHNALIQQCINDFYSGQKPNYSEDKFHCSQTTESTLRIQLETGSYYSLILVQ